MVWAVGGAGGWDRKRQSSLQATIYVYHTLSVWFGIQFRQRYTHKKERIKKKKCAYFWLSRTLTPECSRNMFYVY